MPRPQVADGADGLQLLRVAANVLNKQSRTADRGWSSSWGLAGANNPHRKISRVMNHDKGSRTRMDSLA
jgi:hypothetical protein